MACDPLEPFTKEDFLALWRAILPKSYTEPIENGGNGEGLDIPSLQARIFAELEKRLNRSQQAYFLKRHSNQTDEEAFGARKASGDVEVARAAPTLGDIVLGAGTRFLAVVTDSYGDRMVVNRYLSTADVTLPQGSLGPATVPVEAEWAGYLGNIEAGLIVELEPAGRASVPATVTATDQLTERFIPTESNDTFTSQMVGRYFRLVSPSLVSENRLVPRRVTAFAAGVVTFEPPLDDAADVGVADLVVEVVELVDLGLSVTQPAAITGGRADSLGAIATDRGTGRGRGENDEALRARLCALDDIVSPAAIERILRRVLDPLGIPWRLKETGDIESLMGFTWDVHPWDVGSLSEIAKVGGSQYVGQGGVWLNSSHYRRFFLICVGSSNFGEFGFAYDTTNPLPTAPNAYDLTQGLGGFYDGKPIGYDDVIAQLWQAVNEARSAGVAFKILHDPNL